MLSSPLLLMVAPTGVLNEKKNMIQYLRHVAMMNKHSDMVLKICGHSLFNQKYCRKRPVSDPSLLNVV